MLEKLSPASIVLGPRPGKKSFDRLSELGLTHCCTLLGEREDPVPIKRICKRLDCEWLWMPVDGGNLDTLKAADFSKYVTQIDQVLKDNEDPKIYIHCSAGIHRTGFFTYLLLRVSGMEPGAAALALASLRDVTSRQVGGERIALAEALLLEEPLKSFLLHEETL